LQSEGRASLLQAGGSRRKALQSTIASVGRDAAVMDASLSSSVEQMRRNMRDITMRKYGADIQAKASMMIEPEALPDIPQPTQAPERIFIEPMKVMPGAVHAPTKQSTMAPLISGFTSAAGMLASADWGNQYETRLNVPNYSNSSSSNYRFNSQTGAERYGPFL